MYLFSCVRVRVGGCVDVFVCRYNERMWDRDYKKQPQWMTQIQQSHESHVQTQCGSLVTCAHAMWVMSHMCTHNVGHESHVYKSIYMCRCCVKVEWVTRHLALKITMGTANENTWKAKTCKAKDMQSICLARYVLQLQVFRLPKTLKLSALSLTCLFHMWYDSLTRDTVHSDGMWLLHAWHDLFTLHVWHASFICHMSH